MRPIAIGKSLTILEDTGVGKYENIQKHRWRRKFALFSAKGNNLVTFSGG